MKRPFDIVLEVFLDNVKRSKQNSQFLFEHSDRLLVWVVGFSIGGIALIVANLTQLNKIFSYRDLKLILGLFIISIISGILYRIFFYFYFIHYKNMETFLEISFSKKKTMNLTAEDVTLIDSIEEICQKIKNDFGKKYLKLGNVPQVITDENKEEVLINLKSLHKALGELSKKDFESALLQVKGIYQKALGISDRKYGKIISDYKSDKYLKLYGWLTKISFLLCCTAFILVLIILYFLL